MIRTVTPVALAALLLSGCAFRTVGPAEQASESSMRDAQRLLDEGRRPLVPEQVGAVRLVDQVYTGGTARRAENGVPLPRQWERDNGFVLRRATLMRLFEIGTAITEVTRIPVSFAPDVTNASGAGGAGGAGGGAPAAGAMAGNMGGGPDINAMLNGMGLGPTANPAMGPVSQGNTAGAMGGMIRPLVGTRDAMKVEFQGRLSQFMNQVASHFGVAWEYRNGEIQIFRNVTRTYTVHALPSNISLNSSLAAENNAEGGSGAGATGGSNQRVESDVSVKIWDEVKAGVQGIVGSYGQVTAALSTGTITVTAPPQIATRVQSYLESQNERLGRQVSVSVQVLQVELSDGDNYSLDLQGVFNQAGQFGFGFGNAATVGRVATVVGQVIEAGAPAAATTMLTGAPAMGAAPGVGMGVFNPGSRYNGTNALIQALSTKGRVSTRQTASVVTLNGVPAPLQIANTRGYVRQVSVTSGASGASGGSTTQTQLETGTVTTGFNLSLLPRIDPDGQGLLMQFGVNLSELVGSQNGFETFSSNGSTVQLPNVNSRNFVQQAEVPNGATLVLTGFEQVNETSRREGTGTPEFMGLGGRQNATRGRTAVVILMTPTVVSRRVITAQ